MIAYEMIIFTPMGIHVAPNGESGYLSTIRDDYPNERIHIFFVGSTLNQLSDPPVALAKVRCSGSFLTTVEADPKYEIIYAEEIIEDLI